MTDALAEPFEKPDGEDEVLALAESRGWPTIRGLVGGGDDGLHWRLRIRWFTESQLREARSLLTDYEPSPGPKNGRGASNLKLTLGCFRT